MAELDDEQRYGDTWAPVYDDWFPFDDEGEAAVSKLVELADGGRALELAIGSGRLALPLAAKGIEVTGVDASASMIQLLRAKSGGEEIPVTLGTIRDVPADGEFALVYIVFNSIFALLDQAEQVTCVANVASHLTVGGRFVVECFVPDQRRLAEGGQAQTALVTDEETRFHVLQHDAVNQRVHGQTVSIVGGTVRLFPSHARYIWPSELDLMAQLAGLRLQHRWGGWNDEPFTSDSAKHVSVYERIA